MENTNIADPDQVQECQDIINQMIENIDIKHQDKEEEINDVQQIIKANIQDQNIDEKKNDNPELTIEVNPDNADFEVEFPSPKTPESLPEDTHNIPEILHMPNIHVIKSTQTDAEIENEWTHYKNLVNNLNSFLPDDVKNGKLEDSIKILAKSYNNISSLIPKDLRDLGLNESVKLLSNFYNDNRQPNQDQLSRLDELLTIAENSDINSIPLFHPEFETKSINPETTQTAILSAEHELCQKIERLQKQNQISQDRIDFLLGEKAEISSIKIMVLRMMELIGPQAPEIETVQRIIMQMLGMETEEIAKFEERRAVSKGIDKTPTKIKKNTKKTPTKTGSQNPIIK